MPATATAPAEQAKDKKDAQASSKQDRKDAKPAEQAKQQDAKPAAETKQEAPAETKQSEAKEPPKKDGPITIPRYSETKNTIRYAGEGIAVLALDRTEFEALGNPRKVVVTI